MDNEWKLTEFSAFAEKADDDTSVAAADGAVQRSESARVFMFDRCPLVYQVLNLYIIQT